MSNQITWPDNGELTRRITIKVWTDIPNAAFGLDNTADVGIIRWARREPLMGLLNRNNAQIGELATDYWWVRYGTGTKPEDLSANHVVEWNGRRFRVIDAENVQDAQRFTRIKTKDLGNFP